MAYLVDTSLLGRLANTADVFYPVVSQAVFTLHRRGESLHTTPQNLIEFRSVATRPVAVNGLGLAPAAAQAPGDCVRDSLPHLAGNAGHLSSLEGVGASIGCGRQTGTRRTAGCCLPRLWHYPHPDVQRTAFYSAGKPRDGHHSG